MSEIISTVSYDQQEIIRNALLLHGNGNSIDCDPTYSKGNFYKHGIPKPKYIFDKFPKTEDTVQASSDSLPLENESCNVISFDPPFVMGVNSSGGNGGIIGTRFSSFKNFDELKIMYGNSLKEFYRILKDGGIVIFKCQDCVAGGKQHFSHSWVMNKALQIGFYPKDLFILLAENRVNAFNGTKWKHQYHARKYHSYFWVFQKQSCKVNYEL